MTILADVGILGGNPDLIYGIEVDEIFFDSTTVTQTENDFSSAERVGTLSGTTIFDEPQEDAKPMPIAGKIIGVVWSINNNTTNPQTHTIDIYNNGVLVGEAVLVIAGLQTGWVRSNALNIPFVAGDRIQFSRQKSGATNAGIKGMFGVGVNWD